MKYFIPMPETAEQLKKAYRKLAHKHHPDNGGTKEAMQAVNAEYSFLHSFSTFFVTSSLTDTPSWDII